MNISKETIRVARNLVDAAIVAAGAGTKKQRARAAWRFSNSIWWQIGTVNPGLSRAVNNVFKDRTEAEGRPWVKSLWTKVRTYRRLSPARLLLGGHRGPRSKDGGDRKIRGLLMRWL